MIFKRHRPACCTYCGKPVRRWQKYGGWGPLGFNRFTAEVIMHESCSRKTPRYREIMRKIEAGEYEPPWRRNRDDQES